MPPSFQPTSRATRADGFLGVGTKDVAVKWSDLKIGRDGKDLMLTTDWTKDSLKAMPDYKYERRKPARSGG